MNNIQTVIEFGGFYDSIHSDNIDIILDSYYSDEDGEVLDYSDLDIPYKAISKSYCERWIEGFYPFIADECKLNVNFKNISIQSPREYNFETDKILCDIDHSTEIELIKAYRSDPDFIGYLKEATLSRPGFTSFYSYNDAITNKNNILTVYLFKYLADLFNRYDFESFYDTSCMYELLNYIDMPQLEEATS